MKNLFQNKLKIVLLTVWVQTSATLVLAQLPTDLRQAFEYGQQRRLIGPYQEELLNTLWKSQTDSQKNALRQLISSAPSSLVKFFLLEAYLAGHSYTELRTYMNETKNWSEADIMARSTMRDASDLTQQWNDACSTALVQTALGEGDPIFAWELNKNGGLTAKDPYGEARTLAAQQKDWLERYGGLAVPRGQTGGITIGLLQPLNELYARILGLSYRAEAATNSSVWYQYISQLTEKGFLVPIRIEWWTTGGTPTAHFVLVLDATNQNGHLQFLIHDTWTGHTNWVTEHSLLGNSLAPVNTQFAMSLTHVYVPSIQDYSWLAGRFQHWASEIAGQSEALETSTNNNTSTSGVAAQVLVQNGQWLPVQILQERDGYYFIHFEGYDASYDQWVWKDYVRRSDPWTPNQKVWVYWQDSQWYQGTIVQLQAMKAKVRYSNNYEDWQQTDRLRPRN